MAGAWNDYFPFAAGEELALEARILVFAIKGRATVTAASERELAFEVHVPEQSILGQQLPETRLSIAMTYRGEGTENAATIDLNGRRKEDEAVAMTSDSAEKRRRIAPSVAIGGKSIAFTLCKTGARAAEVREVSGIDLPFDLKIKVKPA